VTNTSDFFGLHSVNLQCMSRDAASPLKATDIVPANGHNYAIET